MTLKTCYLCDGDLSHGLCPRGFEPHSRHVRYKNAFFNKNVLCHSTRTMLLSKEHLLMNALTVVLPEVLQYISRNRIRP